MKKFNIEELGSIDESYNLKEVNTRFGTIKVNTNKQLFFFSGLFGFPGAVNFCLAELPGKETVPFKVFQCVEDESLSFIVLPLIEDKEGEYAIIDKKDIENVASELEITKNDLVVLLICTFNKEGDKTKIYVNAKAPLFIDVNKMAGLQYVFNDDKYDIKFEITE